MRKIVVEVHNDSVFVCILGENGDKIQEKFGILTSKLDKFRNLLIENAIGEVAIKSTRVYRMPIWRVHENYFSLKLENSYYIKLFPGRKSNGNSAPLSV